MRDNDADAASGHPQLWLVHTIFSLVLFAWDSSLPSCHCSMVLALDRQQARGRRTTGVKLGHSSILTPYHHIGRNRKLFQI